MKDNGSGVQEDYVRAMALPHSTSKIATFNDLCTLETYGFRGEALHSIATMSSLSVTTRTEQEALAHSYQFSHKGEVLSTKPVAFERGTKVVVTDLFKSFPVRRQCYRNTKRCKEELRKTESYLLAFGLSHPDVYFQLRHNKHTIWQKPVVSSFESNVENILGPAVFQHMLPLAYHCFNPMVRMRGFVARLDKISSGLTKATSERTFILVNKRPVFIKTLLQVSSVTL